MMVLLCGCLLQSQWPSVEVVEPPQASHAVFSAKKGLWSFSVAFRCTTSYNHRRCRWPGVGLAENYGHIPKAESAPPWGEQIACPEQRTDGRNVLGTLHGARKARVMLRGVSPLCCCVREVCCVGARSGVRKALGLQQNVSPSTITSTV